MKSLRLISILCFMFTFHLINIYGQSLRIKINNNDDVNGSNQNYPSCDASDLNGDYVITWLDFRNGERDIYGQRYNYQGNPIGENFQINEPDKDISNGGPVVTYNNKGEFVIVWEAGYSGIVAQYYDPNGEKIGSNIVLVSFYEDNPSDANIICTEDNGFILAWHAGSIFLMKLDAYGKERSSKIKLNDSQSIHGGSFGFGKSITINKDGNIAVVWSETIEKEPSVYCQIVNAQFEKVGSNINLSGTEKDRNHIYPSVNALDNGNFCAVWYSNVAVGLGTEVEAQIFTPTGEFIKSRMLVNPQNSEYCHLAYVTPGFQNDFVVSWVQQGIYYCKVYNNDGSVKQNTTRVYLDSNKAYPNFQTTVINKDNLLFIWSDTRFGTNGIVFQRYDNKYSPLGKNEFPCKDKGSAWQDKPIMAINKNGSFIVAWEDERNGTRDIYAKVFNKNGTPLSNDLQINFHDDSNAANNASIMADKNGDYIIAWFQSNNLFLQKITSKGEKIGGVIKVNDFMQWNGRSIKMINDSDGFVVISWYAEHSNLISIFSRVLTTDLKIYPGYSISFNYLDTVFPGSMVWDMNDKRETCLLWVNFNRTLNRGEGKLYAQIFNSKGVRVGNPSLIYESKFSDYVNSTVSVDRDGNFIIGYAEEVTTSKVNMVLRKANRNGELTEQIKRLNEEPSWFYLWEITKDRSNNLLYKYESNGNFMGLKIDESLNPIGETFELVGTREFYNTSSQVKFENGNIYFLGSFAREKNVGKDIWLEIKSQINVEQQNNLSSTLLFQNFPNPFNPTTTISYNIPNPEKVSLKVYDVTGQEVVTLVNEYQEKGIHSFSFDGSRLSSGIYIYKLEAGNYMAMKKFILLK